MGGGGEQVVDTTKTGLKDDEFENQVQRAMRIQEVGTPLDDIGARMIKRPADISEKAWNEGSRRLAMEERELRGKFSPLNG